MIALQVTSNLGYGSAFSILYFVAAISRLAYFNVEEEIRSQKEKGSRKSYTGFPVTTSAFFVPLLYSFCVCFENSFSFCFLIGMILFAGLQVSKFKLPHLDLRGLLICLVIGILILGFVIFQLF